MTDGKRGHDFSGLAVTIEENGLGGGHDCWCLRYQEWGIV